MNSKKTRLFLQITILFLLNLIINLIFAKMANREGILSGEEASVSIRDVFLFPYRLQHNTAASNWGGHLFYWISYQFLGNLGLFYGRFAKATEMAFFAPLFFWVLQKRLKIEPTLAFASALLVMLLPGVVNYTWMATENGAEVLFGLLALATLETPALSVGFAAFAALTYGAGLAFTPVIFFLLLSRPDSFRRRLTELLKLSLIYFAVLAVPLLWWKNPARIILGGGEIPNLAGAYFNLKQWFWETWIRGGSYYYFSKYPALSYPVLMIPVLSGAWVSLRRRAEAWIWLGFFTSLSLYVLAGREPGMRRGVPIVLFLAFFLVRGFQTWIGDAKTASGSRFKLARLRSWGTKAVIGFSICFALVQYTKVVKRFGTSLELWTDYEFVTLPGKTMLETCRVLLDEPERLKGSHYDTKMAITVRDYEPDRVLAMMYFIQKAEHLEPSVPLTQESVFKKIKIQRPIR